MDPGSSPLLTDLYQLNMIEAYLAYGETKTAVFELFVRKLPARRGFLVAAGLEQALAFLEKLRFTEDEIDWLKGTGRFSASTLDYLASLRFTGDVHAMPEGSLFFANEPILRVTAPLPEAQLVEARLINPAFPDGGRIQGGAHGARCTWQAARRLWPQARARGRGWAHGRARKLYCRLHRHCNCARNQDIRYPGSRHHGPFLYPGP